MPTLKNKLAIVSVSAIAAALVLMGGASANAATLVASDVRVAEYCTWKYGAASFAFNIDGTWLGWRCNKMSAVYGLNLNESCAHFYGSGVYALNPTRTWNGWRCYR